MPILARPLGISSIVSLSRVARFLNPRVQVALETNTEKATWEHALVQITPDE
jgi:hypothetical protein